MKFYGISCYCPLIHTRTQTHTYLSIYLNLGKECMKQLYLRIDMICLNDNFSRYVSWVVKTAQSLLLRFSLTLPPPPCSCHLLLTPPPAHPTCCSHHLLLTPPPAHTTSLLTLLSHHLPAHTTSVWHQMWEWEVPTPSSPLWPQLGVLWLNSVLKHSLNI